MTSEPRPTPAPAPELKRRILAAVQADPAPTRTAVRQRGWLTLGVCVAVALVIFGHFGGIRTYDRPSLLIVWTCLGWSVAASAAVALAVARGRSALGRSTASLVALVVAAPLVLLAWKVGVTIPFGPEMMAPWPGRPGFRCLGLSLAMAAPLLAALFVIRRRSDPLHPGVGGAALGITAGVAAGTLVDLWCPIAYVPHVLIGHILPLLVTAGLGAWAGRRLLPP
jgi:hypothetical protein